VEAALCRQRGEDRRAKEVLLAAQRRGAGAEIRYSNGGEGWPHLPGEHAPAARPPGIAALLKLLDLRRRPPVTTERQRQSPASAEPLGQSERDCDLVVDLRRGVIVAPRTGQQIARRPLLCELLAHMLQADAAYSAERLFYEVWRGREYHPARHRNTIYVAITRLRRALQDLLPGREVVETTPQGWRLAADVSLRVIHEDGARPPPGGPAS
jgi:DNA-binding winged helix-turn-helix (wHTH) protein